MSVIERTGEDGYGGTLSRKCAEQMAREGKTKTPATPPTTPSEAASHAADCTIYASLINGNPTDGICTCGYGWSVVRQGGDWSQMYSEERLNAKDSVAEAVKQVDEALAAHAREHGGGK